MDEPSGEDRGHAPAGYSPKLQVRRGSAGHPFHALLKNKKFPDRRTFNIVPFLIKTHILLAREWNMKFWEMGDIRKWQTIKKET